MPDYPLDTKPRLTYSQAIKIATLVTALVGLLGLIGFLSKRIYEFESVISNDHRIYFSDSDQDELWDKKSEVKGDLHYQYSKVEPEEFAEYEIEISHLRASSGKSPNPTPTSVGTTPEGKPCILVSPNMCRVYILRGSDQAQRIQLDFRLAQLWAFVRTILHP